MKQQLYRAGLYLRLSRDDDTAGDSGSIQTQQMMLDQYCRESGFHIHRHYIDDGYSGLNFDRPAFQQMLCDIENGLVNLVITKDLSRLGRDYIQTGYYTELYFPKHNVRYIALNDAVDTLHDNNDIAPFKNILNDMYARDLSRKVKSAKRTRAAQGAFIGSHPPYGYRQREDNCNVLVVDEDVAPIVRRIFHLSLGGMGAVTIAKLLRNERILTPAAYKVKQGDSRFVHLYAGQAEDRKYRWAYTTVQRILRDQVYLGHMVGHKSQVVHYKTKQRSLVPKGQQVIVENTHPALVSEEDFQKVQQLMQARHTPQNNKEANIFRGLLYCEECGHRMSMATKKYSGRTILYYRCMHHYHFPDECTGTHYLRFDHLYRIIQIDFERISKLLLTRMGDLLAALVQDDPAIRKQRAGEKKMLETRIRTVESIIKQLYEDFAAGRTNVQNYNRLLADYQQEQAQLQETLLLRSADAPEENDLEERYRQLQKVVEKHLDTRSLHVHMLNELIDRIHVGQRKKIGGEWVQDIRIAYRFAGEIPEL